MYLELDTVWLLICTALIFFMQAGFAMLECGSTRAKNSGNIIMKNLMDYCLGSLLFWIIGFGFIYGSSKGGFVGVPSLLSSGEYSVCESTGLSKNVILMFATVFCATSATIASGAMAGRTRFKAYLIYSAVMSAVVYPISAHWIWSDEGWLAKLGFHDFAGGTAVHVVGGMAAFMGAAFVGARIGRFDKNKKSRAIPGHNLTLSALGIFILWLGWFGFNGGSLMSAQGENAAHLGDIFLNTNLSAAACAVVTMFISWARYGKPDLSLTLNGVLAGLVAITCGCDVVSPVGAALIGGTAAFVLVFGIELVTKLCVDDPVGAVSAHAFCGAWGSLMTGIFAKGTGLIYSGSAEQLILQLAGVLAAAGWSAAAMSVVFFIIKKTVGLRVSEHTELIGLDKGEHGLSSNYEDFLNSAQFITAAADETKIASIDESADFNAADYEADGELHKVVVIMNIARFELLKNALDKIGITGMTVTQVSGCGIQKGNVEYYRGSRHEASLLPKIKVEIVISTVPLALVIDTVKKVLHTGEIGDGKIFVYDVAKVIKIRTGAEDVHALE